MFEFLKKHKEVVFLTNISGDSFARKSAYIINTFTIHKARVYSLASKPVLNLPGTFLNEVPRVEVDMNIRRASNVILCDNALIENTWQTFLINRPIIQYINFKTHHPDLRMYDSSLLITDDFSKSSKKILWVPTLADQYLPTGTEPESSVYYSPPIVKIWKKIIG
jgi:hypothetical protein